MSAQWLPVLVSPKNLNKHMGKKGTVTFSTQYFDKLVASIQANIQPWPRSIPSSVFFYDAVNSALPSFKTGARSVGTEFATRIVLAASKAATTGAAVKVPASEIFIYAASNLGFRPVPHKDYGSEGARAKQFLLRRKQSGSAACILRDAIDKIGLSAMATVSVFACASGTQIVILPGESDLTPLASVHDAYVCGGGITATKPTPKSGNHVQRYMNSVPIARLYSSASKQAILKKIDRVYGNNPYRAVLREAVADGTFNGFSSQYRDPTAESPRVFGSGQSLQFMPGWLRSELFPDWFELDFSNMHLSILNAEAGLGLDLSTSIWNQIFKEWTLSLDKIYAAQDSEDPEAGLSGCGVLHLFNGPLNTGASKKLRLPSQRIDLGKIKKALKASLYSLQFGMEPPAARRAFTIDLNNMGIDPVEVTVLGNLWSETTLLREMCEKIQAHCVSHALDASGLAIKCQSIETDLVKQIYKIAGRYSRKHLCITVHSHDGVSVWARSKYIAARFYRKCSRKMAAELSQLGIQSRLEAKGLSELPPKRNRPALLPAYIRLTGRQACGFNKTTWSTGPP